MVLETVPKRWDDCAWKWKSLVHIISISSGREKGAVRYRLHTHNWYPPSRSTYICHEEDSHLLEADLFTNLFLDQCEVVSYFLNLLRGCLNTSPRQAMVGTHWREHTRSRQWGLGWHFYAALCCMSRGASRVWLGVKVRGSSYREYSDVQYQHTHLDHRGGSHHRKSETNKLRCKACHKHLRPSPNPDLPQPIISITGGHSGT